MTVLHAPGRRLEPLAEAHADELFALLADPALHRHLDEAPPASAEALRRRYRALVAGPPPERRAAGERWLNWVVRPVDDPAAGAVTSRGDETDPPSRAPAGFVQATVLGDGRAWVAFVIGRPHQRRGHARAATDAMLRHLARAHGVARFLANVDEENRASLALVARLGFRAADAALRQAFPPQASERLLVLDASDLPREGGANPPRDGRSRRPG